MSEHEDRRPSKRLLWAEEIHNNIRFRKNTETLQYQRKTFLGFWIDCSDDIVEYHKEKEKNRSK